MVRSRNLSPSAETAMAPLRPTVLHGAPGFGWVAVSFCALTSAAKGRPMERSKVTMRGPVGLSAVFLREAQGVMVTHGDPGGVMRDWKVFQLGFPHDSN